MKTLRIIFAGFLALASAVTPAIAQQGGVVFIPPITPGDCASWVGPNVLQDANGPCGGSGAPGGSNTQLQYNNLGAFAGVAGATTNGTITTFASGDLALSGSSSGTALLNAPATGGGTLTLPAGTDTITGDAATQTLTNKTISGASNTLTNISNGSLTNSSVTIAGNSLSLGGTLSAATLTASLSPGTNSAAGVLQCDGSTTTCSAGVISSTGAVASVSNLNGSLTCSPTTGNVVCSLNVAHANAWSAAQTFGSSDLVASNIVNGSGTLTLPTTTDTLVGRATSDTMTNKTLTTPTINGASISGTLSGAATFSGNLTFSGSNAIGTISSGNLAAGVGYLASNLSGIVPNANGGAGSLTGLLKATSGVVATAVVGTDYAAPGAVDLVPTSVNATNMTTRFASQNIEDVTGASVILTYPAVSGLLANGANVIYAIGGNVTIALTSGTDEICTPSCGSPGASFTLTSGYLGIATTDQAGHLYIAVAVNSASGSGFPITIGSQSVAANSTNTSFAGMTLPSPTLSGTVAGSFTASGNITFSGSNALGTPASANLTNATNYPLSALTGAGTNVLTVLGIAANGTSGGLVRASGSTIDLTDAVNLPASTGISGLGTGVATLLGQTASGTGGLVGQTSPTLSGTIGGNLTFSGNTTLSGTLTAASLSTVGTVAGSVCQTSAGLTLYEAGVNCYAGGGLAVGSSTVTGGTNKYVEYNNSGTLGEYAVSGTGTTLSLTAGPTFTGTVENSSVGSASAPNFSMDGTNTGFYSAASGDMGFTSAGTEEFDYNISTTNVFTMSNSGGLQAKAFRQSSTAGSASAANISLLNGNTGIYSTTSGANLGLTVGGAVKWDYAITNAANLTAAVPIVRKGYTVSTLPTGVTGAFAYVTDASTCVYAATPSGSGSTFCPVVYNGSAWIAD